VNEPQFLLRISGERGEFERVFKAELRAEDAQVVEKLDCFGVGHSMNALR
jgi:hypothetical protein